jgi:phage baseplate assembly protein gpV
MSRKQAFLVATCATVLALTTAAGAAASPPQPIGGTVTYQSSTFNSIRPDGGNLIIDLSATVVYTGTFNGTSTLHGTLILHPDGTANAHDVEIFTGTVDGTPGTVTFNLNVQADATLKVRGTDVITDATGGLSGLHGMLLLDAQVSDKLVGPVGTYSGQIEGLGS